MTIQFRETFLGNAELPFIDGVRRPPYDLWSRVLNPVVSQDGLARQWQLGALAIIGSGASESMQIAATPAGFEDEYYQLETSIVGGSSLVISGQLTLQAPSPPGNQNFQFARVSSTVQVPRSFLTNENVTTSGFFQYGRNLIVPAGGIVNFLTIGALAAGQTWVIRFLRDRKPGVSFAQVENRTADITDT